MKELADKEGYETFVIPDDVGGRYSVLTAVGLLPIAVAGCDIEQMMNGAAAAMEAFASGDCDNDCYRYAAARNILYRKGKAIELLVSYEPNFVMMAEWFKQLFGESEAVSYTHLVTGGVKSETQPELSGGTATLIPAGKQDSITVEALIADQVEAPVKAGQQLSVSYTHLDVYKRQAASSRTISRNLSLFGRVKVT